MLQTNKQLHKTDTYLLLIYFHEFTAINEFNTKRTAMQCWDSPPRNLLVDTSCVKML